MGDRDGRSNRILAYAVVSTMRKLVSNKVEGEDGLLGRTHANLHIHANIILTKKLLKTCKKYIAHYTSKHDPTKILTKLYFQQVCVKINLYYITIGINTDLYCSQLGSEKFLFVMDSS